MSIIIQMTCFHIFHITDSQWMRCKCCGLIKPIML